VIVMEVEEAIGMEEGEVLDLVEEWVAWEEWEVWVTNSVALLVQD
jgi:hypothetical protein